MPVLWFKMASTPPPFQPQPEYQPTRPPKSMVSPVLIVLAVLGGVCCLGVFGLVQMVRTMGGPIMATGQCGIQLTATAAAIQDYVKKNGKYPPAETWQDAISKEYEETYNSFKRSGASKEDNPVAAMFKLSEPGKPLTCGSGKDMTGFAYNSEVAGKTPEELKKDDPVVVFEVNDPALNRHGEYSKAPAFQGVKIAGEARERLTSNMSDDPDMGDFGTNPRTRRFEETKEPETNK